MFARRRLTIAFRTSISENEQAKSLQSQIVVRMIYYFFLPLCLNYRITSIKGLFANRTNN